jgi:hypothetical protein
MLSDHDKLLLLEPLFYSIIITPMILTLNTKNENVNSHSIKVTVGSVVFSEFGKICLCLNKDTRKRVLECLCNLDDFLFVGFVQTWTRNSIKTWLCNYNITHFHFCVGNENSMKYEKDFKLKAVDFHMPTEQDPTHSVVKITVTVNQFGIHGHKVSTQNFEYPQKDHMADFCFRNIFEEDLNVHIARMIQKTHRFFRNRVAEQEDEARNKKRIKDGLFATPTVYMNFSNLPVQ